jgi:tetratricopeptide (TPR) repeat protein
VKYCRRSGRLTGRKDSQKRFAMDRIERLKEFLAMNPEDNFLQHALALEYLKAGDEKQARTLFETILTRDEKYIGSYYHLAKLLEKMDDRDAAIAIYEKGMVKAKEAGDNHAYNELRSAYEEYCF